MVQGGDEVLAGKGYTSYAIALATARIIEAVLYDEHQVLAVTSLLTGYAGISDVCLSVPSVTGSVGVLRVLPVPLSEAERAGLQHSARTVRAVLDTLALDRRSLAACIRRGAGSPSQAGEPEIVSAEQETRKGEKK